MLGKLLIISVDNMLYKIFFAVGLGFSLVLLTWLFISQNHSNLLDNDLQVSNQTEFSGTDASFNGRGSVTRLPNTVLPRQEGLAISDSPILEKSGITELESGFYKITEKNGSFAVYYDAESGAFTITLAGEDTKKSRSEAERYLLSDLPYSKEQWCLFDLTIATNEYENPRIGGINVGLSFCPGSVEL